MLVYKGNLQVFLGDLVAVNFFARSETLLTESVLEMLQ